MPAGGAIPPQALEKTVGFFVLPPPVSIYSEKDALPLIESLQSTKLLAFDTETSGLVRHKDRALILSLSDGKGRWTVWPSALPYFRELLEDPTLRLVGHNVNFDQWMLLNVGIDLSRYEDRSHARVYDTLVMHALLDDASPHDLKYLARQYLDIDMVPFMKIYGSQLRSKTLTQVLLDPANEEVTNHYASLDAFATYKLFLRLQLQASRELLSVGPFSSVWEYYTETELLYTKVLWHMERRGIQLDVLKLIDRAPALEKEISGIESWFCHKLRRYDVNLKSGPQMAHLFFTTLGHQPMSYTDGGLPQVNKTLLKSLAKGGCEYATQLLRYRDLTKQLDTYVIGLLEHVGRDGRIHTQFNQTGARCMPAGQLVLTNRGYIPVEHVRAGDLVITHTGNRRKVVATSIHAPAPIYKIHLSNGLTLRTTGQHPYRTGNGWTNAQELRVGTEVAVHSDAEDWKEVADWNDFEVSSWGRVRNRKTNNVLAQQPKGSWGHLKVTLYRGGAQTRALDNKKDLPVHRLVAAAFCHGTEGPEVRHLNGIAWDNTARNLCYGTATENRQDARKHGTMSLRRSGRTKITEADVEAIRAAAGHPHGPSSTAKLTQKIADEIRSKATGARGEIPSLAREYSVSYQAIYSILRNKTWVSQPAEGSRPVEELAAEYGLSARYVREIQEGRKWKAEDYIESSVADFYSATVVSVQIEPSEVSYGIEVEDDHSHVTGGVVTHNTGRLSSSQPNLQNQPGYIRDAYVAKEGYVLKALDEQQLEMRILAHLSRDPALCDAIKSGKDVHSATAAVMYKVPYEAVNNAKVKHDNKEKLTAEEEVFLGYRKNSKTIQFGIVYGMGPGKLAASLGVSLAEAKALIEQYFEAVPGVKEYFNKALAAARVNGYSSTAMGRRRQLQGIWSSLSGEVARAERQVKNAPIQGFASEILKVAMNRIFCDPLLVAMDVEMLIQVHDELVFELPAQYEHDEEITARIQRHMTKAITEVLGEELAVPLDTSGNSGPTWGDCK